MPLTCAIINLYIFLEWLDHFKKKKKISCKKIVIYLIYIYLQTIDNIMIPICFLFSGVFNQFSIWFKLHLACSCVFLFAISSFLYNWCCKSEGPDCLQHYKFLVASWTSTTVKHCLTWNAIVMYKEQYPQSKATFLHLYYEFIEKQNCLFLSLLYKHVYVLLSLMYTFNNFHIIK